MSLTLNFLAVSQIHVSNGQFDKKIHLQSHLLKMSIFISWQNIARGGYLNSFHQFVYKKTTCHSLSSKCTFFFVKCDSDQRDEKWQELVFL